MSKRTIVLMSPGETIENDNPFVELLIRHLPTDITVRSFSWKSAFFSRYDVLHIHWPEHLLSAGSPTKRRIKSLLLLGLIARNRLMASNLRTVHNLRPHEEAPYLTRLALNNWESSCSASVFLSRAGKSGRGRSRPGALTAVIPHGDYRPLVDRLRRPPTEPKEGRLLAFGYLRPYKGLEQLIAALRDTPRELGLTLRITGTPLPKSYGEELLRLASGDERISMALGRQTDEDLVDEILTSSAVALPYKQVYNSGAALLALTLSRPLIVTDSPTMRELGDEVGNEWVTRLSRWDPESLSTPERVRIPTATTPALEGREWSSLSEQYAVLYRSLRESRRLLGRHRAND